MRTLTFFKFVLGQGGDAFRASGSPPERAFRVRNTVCDAVWRDTRGDAKAAEGVSLRGQDDGSDDEARVNGEGTRCVVVLSRAFFISNVNYFFNRKERRLVHRRATFGVLVNFLFFWFLLASLTFVILQAATLFSEARLCSGVSIDFESFSRGGVARAVLREVARGG